jgi:adenine-specific DNA-methyltransferase
MPSGRAAVDGLPKVVGGRTRIRSMTDVQGLIDRTEERRRRVGARLDARNRDRLGQFFTPAPAAELIAGMPRLASRGSLRILDPGAGIGSLAATLTARVIRETPEIALDIVAVELDPTIVPDLVETLQDCAEVCAVHGVEATTACLTADFPAHVTGVAGVAATAGPLARPFDLVIMNPPYKKLPSGSPLRRRLAAGGVICPNLYSAFLAAGVLVLDHGGQLVSITPRSFANGPYFNDFRRFFFDRLAVDRIHIFESRSTIFSDSSVLQENVILSTTLGGARGGAVTLSSSRGHEDESRSRAVPYDAVLDPTDRNRVLHVHANEEDTSVAKIMSTVPCTLDEIGVGVSTGRVVDFRAREFLYDYAAAETVPLVYPGNLRDGEVHWPATIRKPQAIARRAETAKLLLPNERFVLVKRFSAKEERRRIVAAVYQPPDPPASEVGFENHLNVFHRDGRGLTPEFAAGLCL